MLSYLSKKMLRNLILHFINAISEAENPFGGSLNKHASLVLRFELVNHVLVYLSGGSLEKDLVVQFKYSSADLSDKEKLTVFYLAGYVFSAFSLRLRFTKKIIRIAKK